ncbi:MAG: phage tail sheath subtilisin-like domain-containing protein [Eubacteriales bacterium]
MASFFTIGETKTRPGMYYRYENWGTPPTVGADDGKCACTIRSDWGPLDSAVLLESYDVIGDYFGTGGAGGTVDIPLEQFGGGAKSVRAVRVGSGGTKGSYTLLDEDGTEVLSLRLKYVGSRPLCVTLRPTVEAELSGVAECELLVLEGTTQLERITFDNQTGEKVTWALVGKVSHYVDFLTVAVTDSKLATIDQKAFVGGTDPDVTVDSYSNAFGVLENYRWNVLALDTEDLAVQMMVQSFVNRIYEDGAFCMAVIGEPTTTAFETRLSRASSFNDYQMVYVGSGFVDMSGNVYEGTLAAARVSGMIAGTSSNKSITHLCPSSAVDLVEYLSNAQQEQAILAGMLTFSLSSSNVVWVESGVNTLVNPNDDQDEGWKKIKRTKVRFELFQRLADTVEGLVGRVNNNSDGRATIIQACNNICNTMVAEGKLHTGACVAIDPDRSPAGDSAWFVVYADDVDALEKLYYNFKFRFAVED